MTDDAASAKPLLDKTIEELKKEVERLNIENLLLRQKTEFEHLLNEHKKEQSQALAQHRSQTESQIDKRLTGLTVVGLVVLGLGWWSTLQPIRQLVTQRLNREFASPNIQKLISDSAQRAASTQTKGMMENILKPAIDTAMKQIQSESDKVTQFSHQLQATTQRDMEQLRKDLASERADERRELAQMRQEYSAELTNVKTLNDYEQKVRDIQLLEGAAVQGDAAAFEKTEHVQIVR